MATIDDKKVNLVKSLYYKDGLSMTEVSAKLGVSIDAVCYFMRRHHLSRRSPSESNRVSYLKKELSFHIKSNLTANQKILKTIGAVLYLCEGYKADKSHGIDFANCDPEMAVIFTRFLRTICGVDEKRLRVLLYCYSNQDTKELLNFWSRKIAIPKKQFSKPYVRNDYKIAKLNKMPYGLVHIRYSDKKLLAVVRKWISEFKQEYAPVV
ncbi:MAG: hypothetical protein AAB635_02005 [Patescibacteria group bacterium]